MVKVVPLEKTRLSVAVGAVVVCLLITTPRRSRGEDLADFKVMYYMEDDDRIQVISPTVRYQKELSSTLTIKIDGIYNSISGATPTGAPPPLSTPAPVSAAPSVSSSSSSSPASSPSIAPTFSTSFDDDDEWEEEDDDDDDDRRIGIPSRISRLKGMPYSARAGATPAPTPAPTPTPVTTPAAQPAAAPSSNSSSSSGSSTPAAAPAETAAPAPTPANTNGKVPLADFEEERLAGNIELIKQFEQHTVSGLFSYSTESDYDSMGIAFTDGIDFNQKNTTLLLGAAYTHDKITPANGAPNGTKDTTDLIIGLSQVLDPRTLLTLNFTLGQTEGLLSDPYKVVELNGELVWEKRPDSKDKQIGYISLAHFFPSANGSLEGGYRYYTDGFGIDAHTMKLSWFQRIGTHWIVRPQVRYYDQSEADFYAVRFTGAPEYYSSDYRVSALTSWGGGLKLIWMPTTRFQLDAEFMRYQQSGKDGVTSQDAYPGANVFILGARIWL